MNTKPKCDCPDDVSKIREFCADDCMHIRPWGAGRSRYEKWQRANAK
jgi:hypothetical protein